MADALLSAFLGKLASDIGDLAEHEVKLVMGVGDAIENLKKNLKDIRLVLKDAEKKQWQDDAVKFWMDELKDISYDMDGVLDEWGTAILKAEIEKVEIENASFVRKIKVHFSALCRCFHFGPLSQVRHRLDISHKIENLNGRLDSIASRKDRFGFSLTTRTDESIRSEVTTSIIDVSKVFGQDTYKKNVIDRLLCEGSQEGLGRNLHIIPVVGMGGIGKTTLAKMVFHDDAVKSHFGRRIWICVSDTFDLFKIAGAIVEQLTGQAPGDVGSEALMQKLIESITDAKFLLVLDDVWTEDYQQWEKLEAPLLRGAIASRVVVTTRKVEVARMMGVGDEHFMIRMKELSEMDCWSLFSEIAFFRRSKEDQDDLAEVGRKIVRKCSGLPLAAKTLGSLLRTKRTKNEWLNVLQSEIWRLERVKEKLFFPLLLSYFDLSPIEKRCFSYCALFPKDHDITKDDLIYLWMAQGFFSWLKDANKELSVAERCFETLAMCSFFQDFAYSWIGYIVGCKMHDIVHDFAQFITSDEYATLSTTNNIKEEGGLSARHLTIILPSDYQDRINPLLVSSRKNLQSLMFVGHKIVDQVVIDSCPRFISLRTLRLEVDISLRIPDSIGDLIQLRYLNLSDAFSFDRRFRVLPSKLGNLCNLQTLIIRGFFVPKEVVKLINLRRLQYSGYGDYAFQILPKGIGRIKNLQELKAKFSPSTENNVKEKFQLGDLGGLSCLRELQLGGVAIDQGHIDGARQARLHQKTNLVTLYIYFALEGDEETHEAVLEALQPPPNLELLYINLYGGAAISPSWMISSSSSTTTLNHLKMLWLENCYNCETLPPLGHLQSLEILVIRGFSKVKKVGPEFLGIADVLEQEGYSSTIKGQGTTLITPFPKLKRLQFYVMHSWCEWVGISGWDKESTTIRIMPCLEYLEFDSCHELEALPEFLETTPLKELEVSHSEKLKDEIEKKRNKFQHITIFTYP